jgi:8-oxo-dGTP pyrophosphatase MutT (NUDIX family)
LQLRSGAFDLWVFRRDVDAVRYLIMQTSQEKADRWFNGGRFWQIPGGHVAEGQALEAGVHDCLAACGLQASSVWAVEHTYMVYNRRQQGIEVIVVLAADATGCDQVTLTWEHSGYQWATADVCLDLLGFRHLKDGLEWTRRYVTEAPRQLPELRIA